MKNAKFLKIALKNQIPTSHRLHNDFSADTLFRKEENTTHQTTSIQRAQLRGKKLFSVFQINRSQ